MGSACQVHLEHCAVGLSPLQLHVYVLGMVTVKQQINMEKATVLSPVHL